MKLTKLKMAVDICDRSYRYGPPPKGFSLDWFEHDLFVLMKLTKSEVRDKWYDLFQDDADEKE